MDNNLKKVRRFNIIDVLVIVAAAAVIVIIANFFIESDSLIGHGEKTRIRYTIQIPQVTEDFVGLIKQGESVCETENDAAIGIVENVIYRNSKHSVYNKQSGVFAMVTYENRKDVEVSVISDCYIDKNRYYVSGVCISAGREVSFRTPGYAGTGTVIDIDEVKEILPLAPEEGSADSPENTAK